MNPIGNNLKALATISCLVRIKCYLDQNLVLLGKMINLHRPQKASKIRTDQTNINHLIQSNHWILKTWLHIISNSQSKQLQTMALFTILTSLSLLLKITGYVEISHVFITLKTLVCNSTIHHKTLLTVLITLTECIQISIKITSDHNYPLEFSKIR